MTTSGDDQRRPPREVDGGLVLDLGNELDALKVEQLAERRRVDANQRRQFSINLILAVLTAGSMVGALAQAWFARRSADAAISAATIAQKALTDSAKGSGQVLEQMTTQAEAAKVQAEASRAMAAHLEAANRLSSDGRAREIERARREQRAVIDTPVLAIDAEPEANTPPGGEKATIGYPVRNVGRVPAIQVRTRMWLQVLPSEPPEPKWADIESSTPMTLYPISEGGATAVLKSEMTFTFSAVGIGRYRSKQQRFYAWILIEYADAFGSGSTKFCAWHEFGDARAGWHPCANQGHSTQ